MTRPAAHPPSNVFLQELNKAIARSGQSAVKPLNGGFDPLTVRRLTSRLHHDWDSYEELLRIYAIPLHTARMLRTLWHAEFKPVREPTNARPGHTANGGLALTNAELTATTAEEFVALLRLIRAKAGINCGQIAVKTGMARSSVYNLVNAKRTSLPTLPDQVRAFIETCGLRRDQVVIVMSLWERLDANRNAPAKPEQPSTPPPDVVPSAQEIHLTEALTWSRRASRLSILGMTATVLALVFSGAAMSARDAQPGDTLWGLTKVLYSSHAKSIEAAANVREDLSMTTVALAEGDLAQARTLLLEAPAELPHIAVEDGQEDLAARHADLASKLPPAQ